MVSNTLIQGAGGRDAPSILNSQYMSQVLIMREVSNIHLKDIEIKRKADAIMSQMAYVFSRDEKSYQYTKSILSGDKIGEFIDMIRCSLARPLRRNFGNEKIPTWVSLS